MTIPLTKSIQHLKTRAQQKDLLYLVPGTNDLKVRCIAHEDSVTFCHCKKKYDINRSMLCCDFCSDWFHYDCVGITAPPKGKWYCPKCQANMARRKKD